MALYITESLLNEIVDRCAGETSMETCGMVAGRFKSDRPTRHIPMENDDASPHTFTFDPIEQIAAYAEMDDRNEECVVVYHSHIDTEAAPSMMDINYMQLSRANYIHYLIVSLRDRRDPDVRSWRWSKGDIYEEKIILLGEV